MKDLIAAPADDFDKLGIEGTARLVGSLMENVASNLVRIGRAVGWLRDQGCEVTQFEDRLPRGDLRAIADGLILPEVWLKLGTQRRLLRAVSALPRAVQQCLASGTPVEVVERKPDGSTDVRKVAIESLPSELIPQVFDGSRLRPVAEQIAATMRPANEPIIVNAVADLESLTERAFALLGEVKNDGKRNRKRAAMELREVTEKIALLVS